jgi:hypothetical protein
MEDRKKKIVGFTDEDKILTEFRTLLTNLIKNGKSLEEVKKTIFSHDKINDLTYCGHHYTKSDINKDIEFFYKIILDDIK